jgi:hypothetical protein
VDYTRQKFSIRTPHQEMDKVVFAQVVGFLDLNAGASEYLNFTIQVLLKNPSIGSVNMPMRYQSRKIISNEQ